MVKICEIYDIEFQKALHDAVKGGEDRRFENHATDLIYCLISAWARKVLPPEEFSDTSYSMILKWMSGKGIEIGIVNAMGLDTQKPVHYNPDDPDSVGTTDFRFSGRLYEMKTTMYSAKTRRLPYMTQTLQLMQYMATEGDNLGRLKLWFIYRYRDPITKRFRVEPRERTWEVYMSDEDIEYRLAVMNRDDNLLSEALLTGDYTILPKSVLEWYCRDCYTCALLAMLSETGELPVAHAKYLKEREEFYERKRKEGVGEVQE